MARKVSWTETAAQDLEAAADYISRDSPSYAAAFVHEILEASLTLSDLSERGRRVPEFPETALRELIVRNYRLIYQVTPATVVIIALVHGARDL